MAFQDVTIQSLGQKKPKFGSQVFIAAGSRIIGDVTLGDQTNIWYNCVLRGDVNWIKVGKRTNIQDGSIIHVTDQGCPTLIGDDVTIGHLAMIHACTIEDRCLIGMGSTILDGAVIGQDCLVGANSLVTQNKKFPPGSLIMGSPAKVIRPLTTEEIASLQASADHYLEIIAKHYQTEGSN